MDQEDTVQLKIRVPRKWKERLEAMWGSENAYGKRTPITERVVQYLARELGEPYVDPHRKLSEGLRGKPNPHHPSKNQTKEEPYSAKGSANNEG